MNWRFITYIFAATGLVWCCCLPPSPLSAATLQLTAQKGGPPYVLSLVVDHGENLAGVKLTILYPKELLQYKTAEKSAAFNAFMHVINDTTPGKLIIVMASARGVLGNDLQLFELTFAAATGMTPASVKIEATGCQLMSEDLKDIPCETAGTSVSLEE